MIRSCDGCIHWSLVTHLHGFGNCKVMDTALTDRATLLGIVVDGDMMAKAGIRVLTGRAFSCAYHASPRDYSSKKPWETPRLVALAVTANEAATTGGDD